MITYLGRLVDLTRGVMPLRKRLWYLLRLTMFSRTRWFRCVFSTVKWNQNLKRVVLND